MKTSLRPALVVSHRADAIAEPSAPPGLGLPSPLGRGRMLYALPLGETPNQWIKRPLLVVSSRSDGVGDQSADQSADQSLSVALVGRPGVWVPRLLTARWVEDTRRLAG